MGNFNPQSNLSRLGVISEAGDSTYHMWTWRAGSPAGTTERLVTMCVFLPNQLSDRNPLDQVIPFRMVVGAPGANGTIRGMIDLVLIPSGSGRLELSLPNLYQLERHRRLPSDPVIAPWLVMAGRGVRRARCRGASPRNSAGPSGEGEEGNQRAGDLGCVLRRRSNRRLPYSGVPRVIAFFTA